MAIVLSDNIQTNAPKPTDSRYLNNLAPYSSVSAANSAIGGSVRYTGLTVNVLGAEYWYKNGIADVDLIVKSTGSGSGGSGESISKLICQTSHGFSVKDVIGWSGGTYNKAIGLTTYDGEILGLVSKCYNANCFDLTQAGYVTGLTSLTANTTYFLSDVTAGLLSATKPTIVGHIAKSVMVANSTTSGWVLPYPGYVLATSSGGTGSTSSSLSEFTITGDSSATGFTVNHAKNKQYVVVDVVRGSTPYDTIYTNVTRPNSNCVCVTFDTAPTTGQQFKILIIS